MLRLFLRNACIPFHRLRAIGRALDRLSKLSAACTDDPVDYIERLLKCIVNHLGLPWNVIRSSTLNLPPSLRGQYRILEIARQLGARRYVNAPGGRSLYDPVGFSNAGIDLCFLPEYQGSNVSILERLIDEDRDELARDIRAIPDELRAAHSESRAG